jgi:hypothetical protein
VAERAEHVAEQDRGEALGGSEPMAATPKPKEGRVEVWRNCMVRIVGTASSAAPIAPHGEEHAEPLAQIGEARSAVTVSWTRRRAATARTRKATWSRPTVISAATAAKATA